MVEIEMALSWLVLSFILGMAAMGFVGWIEEREERKVRRETRGWTKYPQFNLILPYKRRK